MQKLVHAHCTEASLCKLGSVNLHSVDEKGRVNHLHGLTCFPGMLLKCQWIFHVCIFHEKQLLAVSSLP